jgi:hypothetical protein
MARQPGTKAEDNTVGDSAVRTVGRAMGFIILASLAMAIITAMVLMPPWASAVRAEHDLAVKRAETEHSRKLVAAGARLNNALPYDPIVNERLVKGTVRRELVRTPPIIRPPEPSGWRLELADKLAQPKTKRGLFFVACVALTGAFFLFIPPPLRRASRCRQAT